jgi:hypothetical protein
MMLLVPNAATDVMRDVRRRAAYLCRHASFTHAFAHTGIRADK